MWKGKKEEVEETEEEEEEEDEDEDEDEDEEEEEEDEEEEEEKEGGIISLIEKRGELFRVFRSPGDKVGPPPPSSLPPAPFALGGEKE